MPGGLEVVAARRSGSSARERRPSHQPADSITWNVPAGETKNYHICITACSWTAGSYEAILWQYYSGQYNNIAQYYAPIS
jgi:hypothetical protein